jgi:hypothetical protein
LNDFIEVSHEMGKRPANRAYYLGLAREKFAH